MTDRVVLLATTHRVAPGLLSWPAWAELRTGTVCTADAAHPQLPYLRAAGIDVRILDPGAGAATLAREFRALARPERAAVWLAAPDGDEEFSRALGELVARDGGVELELVPGSYDVPGARLLDVVAVMDRLRSPGGCPWDAEQTHLSLAPYLLEEAYEAYAAVEEGDLAALREELGDVLLQVAFHARLAEELPDDERWSIDDLAGDLVTKLVRRHPHVFADRSVRDAAEVAANWDDIKAAEKGRTSVTEGVPLGQPALALAAKLHDRALKAGLPPALVAAEVAAAETLPQAVCAGAAAVAEAADPVDAIGELLFTAVALARMHQVDPEAALRGRARRFRDRLQELEGDAGTAV